MMRTISRRDFLRGSAAAVVGTMLAGSLGVTAGASENEKLLRKYFGDTPETLNPHTTASNYELLLDMTGSLYREVYDTETEQMSFVPELAEGDPEPQDDEHKVWTIKVGEGYTFADGTVIDANVMEYSMKMLDDPKLANRNACSEFVNSSAYIAGECEWEDVGFKAIDDYTLQIEFADDHEPESAKDVRELFTFIGYGAVHPEMYESCMSEDRTTCTYGINLDTFVASALYEPTSLIEGQYLELTRRTDGGAPLEDVYTPDRVTYNVVSDSSTAIELFQQGELDYVVANQAAYDEYPNARFCYNANLWGIFVNGVSPTCEALKDANMRYALYWGLDRESVVGTVYPTYIPTAYQYLTFSTMPDPEDKDNSVVKYYETEEAQAVRMDGHELSQNGYDPDLALEYFEKAYENYGSQKITIPMIYSDSSNASKTFAEALQAAYQALFGEDKFAIELQATASATIYEEIARDTLNYDLCCSCGVYQSADYPWNNTNWVYSGEYTYNTQYCIISEEALQEEWDDLFYKCALYDYKWDAQAKLESCARMEEILYTDCCFIPTHSGADRYFFSSNVTPVMEEGDVDLDFCMMQILFNEE